ncbi:MAG TPA: TetR/AcrR family transcriptional regulator [Myxococcota bacterium]|nr:TetR/AcrR family transcriptional regulator [Myxococcota bacterium]
MPRPKLRTPELRERVLRVAVALLARDGAAQLTARKVAERAETSTPAVYELFGDKSGLVREIFFEGFRMLRHCFDDLPESGDARADLVGLLQTFRSFIRANPVLAELMFLRRFTDFDPSPSDQRAGDAVRKFVVSRVRRCVDAGLLAGDPTDIAHALVALTEGLAATEVAGWLGTSKASVERRWDLAIGSILDGLAAGARQRSRAARRSTAATT